MWQMMIIKKVEVAERMRVLPENEWLARLEAWVAGRLGLPGNL